LADSVNRGLGGGFILGAPTGLLVMLLVLAKVVEL
jgi:hypothetical protein